MMDTINNEYIKEIMEVKVTPEAIDIIGRKGFNSMAKSKVCQRIEYQN
jgi:hypothetical protein